MTPRVQSLDHLVLTVSDLAQTCRFYEDILGMSVERFEATDGSLRTALRFGAQKINLHLAGHAFAPHAARPVPGSADLCFLTETPIADWQAHLARHAVEVIDGPVPRTGAAGPILSLYIRDPDGTLIEIAVQS